MVFDLALGTLLPGTTALAVRTWLSHQGKAVMPWSWMAGHRLFFLVYMPMFAAPSLILACRTRGILRRQQGKPRWAATGAVIGASMALPLASVALHWQWRQDVSDPLVLVVMPIFVCGESLACAVAAGVLGEFPGWWIDRTRVRFRST